MFSRLFYLLSWYSLGCIGFAISQPEKQYFNIQPKDAAIAQIYAGLLDRDIEKALLSFNPDSGLVQVRMPSTMNHKNSDPFYLSCKQTAHFMEALGFAYSLKTSKYHQSPLILQHLRTIFKALENNPLQNEDTYYLNEAWMTAFISVQNNLTANERIQTLKIINTRLDEMLKQEPGHDDSRAVIWCGVMAVAARFNGNQNYMTAAEQKLKSIIPIIFHNDGQVLENDSPEINRSLTSLQYLFLFRMMNGSNQWDKIIIRCLDWAAQLHTFHGVPLMMNRSLQHAAKTDVTSKLLSALSYYGQQDEVLNQTAARYLEAIIAIEPGFCLQHNTGHFLRGMQFHTIPNSMNSVPYQSYSTLYSSPQSLYYTVGKNYQSLITMQSAYHYQGLHTWSYKGQPPVIVPSLQSTSRLISVGMDSAQIPVKAYHQDANQGVNQAAYFVNSVTPGLETLVYQQNDLITGLVFSNDLMVVVYHDQNGNGRVDWISNLSDGAQMSNIENGVVLFSDTEAKLFLPPIEPVIQQNEHHLMLRFSYSSGIVWFTFAGPRSMAVVQPVTDGIVLVQLNESGLKTNLVLNLSAKPFQTEMNFPGTNIAIPQLAPFHSALVNN